jgi:hypothetical protein
MEVAATPNTSAHRFQRAIEDTGAISPVLLGVPVILGGLLGGAHAATAQTRTAVEKDGPGDEAWAT